MRVALAALLVLSLLCVTASAKKGRQWQTGTLVEINQSNVDRNSVKVPYSIAAVTATKGLVSESYVIDAGKYTYESAQVRKAKQPLALTVKGPVQFAVENDHLYIKDQDGKEYDTKLITKTLKPLDQN
jgi:hypothetical protein